MYRFEILNKLKTRLGDAVTICDEFDELHRQNFYSVAIDLGTGFAGEYEGGYWGDCTIANDELKLHFIYGDIYEEGEENFGEGIVDLDYAEGSGLAYTGALDKLDDACNDACTDKFWQQHADADFTTLAARIFAKRGYSCYE